MTYERTRLGSDETGSPLLESIGQQRFDQAASMTRVCTESAPNRWLFIAVGIAAGLFVGRWLKRRHRKSNPMPWSVLKVGDGFWVVNDERTGDTLGFVVEMKGYYSAHTAKRVFIGAMPTLVSAAGLVYGRFWEKFEGADTLVGVPAQNPKWTLEKRLGGGEYVVVGDETVGLVCEDEHAPGTWEAATGLHKARGGFSDEASAIEWVLANAKVKHVEIPVVSEKGTLIDSLQEEDSTERQEQVSKSRKRLAKEKVKAAKEELPDEELDKRIVITLYRSKIKGKTYTKDLAGKEREVPKQLLLPKSLTADEIAPKVKSTRNRVFDRAKALARDNRIFGVCGYKIVNVPTTREDSKGRKIMTFRQKKAFVCKFAAFGPNGEVGFFARGEHKLPEENPGYQKELPFKTKKYIVKERKPLYRSTAGRMVWSKWKEVSKHDTLTAALNDTFIRHPPAVHPEWRKQRAVFLGKTRVSEGNVLLKEYRNLPEQP